MGKSTISMAMFNSYVSSPEGITNITQLKYPSNVIPWSQVFELLRSPWPAESQQRRSGPSLESQGTLPAMELCWMLSPDP